MQGGGEARAPCFFSLRFFPGDVIIYQNYSRNGHQYMQKEGAHVKITTIGEILIDMTQTGIDENGIPHFAANPGGAPANVAVAAAKLGAQSAFIGCIGESSR